MKSENVNSVLLNATINGYACGIKRVYFGERIENNFVYDFYEDDYFDRDAKIIWVYILDDDKENMLDFIIRKNDEEFPDYVMPTRNGRIIICYIED